MAISLVASAYAASPDASSTNCRTDGSGGGVFSGLKNTTGATLLIGATAYYNGRDDGDSLHDSKGNTWTPLTIYGQSGSAFLSSLFLAYVNSATPIVGSNHGFDLAGTGPGGGTAYNIMWVWAFSGTDGTQLRAGTDIGTSIGSNPTSLQAPSSIGLNTDVVISAICDNLGAGTSQVIDLSFIPNQAFGYIGGTHIAGCGAYKIISGAVQPTWSGLDGSDASIACVAFKATGGGGGGSAVKRNTSLNGVGASGPFFGNPLAMKQAKQLEAQMSYADRRHINRMNLRVAA